MEFNRLRNALDLRKDKEPSINLFMSLIDILIKDIKEESGCDIQSIEVGDEQTAVIATNVCRNINKICKNNIDNFQRGVELLNRQLKELDENRDEIEKCSEEIKNIIRMKNSAKSSKEKLESEKEELLRINNEYEDIQHCISNLNNEIEELKKFDLDGKREELKKLEEEKKSFTYDIADVQIKIEETAEEIDSLKRRKTSLDEKLERLKKECSREKDIEYETETKVSGLNKKYDVLVISNNDLKAKKEKLVGDIKELEASVENIKKEIEEYRNDVIEPMKSEEYKLTVEKTAYLNNKQELEARLESISGEITQIITEISDLNNSIDEEKKKLETKKLNIEERKFKLNEYKEENEKLIKQYNQIINELEEKQNFVAQTEEKMEAIIASKAKEEERKRELELKASSLQKEYENIFESNKLLEADVVKSNNEINECKAKYDELLKEQEKAEAEITQLNSLISDVSFVNRTNIGSKIDDQKEKLVMLKDAANNLKKATNEVRSIMKAVPDETISLEDLLSDTINKLDDYLKTIGKSIVKCADAIKLEENRI